MELLFIGLTVGCLGFLGKVIMDYLHNVPMWKEKVHQSELEQQQFEIQIQELVRARENSAGEAKKIDEEIKTMEKMRDELKNQIDETKKDMARKGRIIMPRKPDEG